MSAHDDDAGAQPASKRRRVQGDDESGETQQIVSTEPQWLSQEEPVGDDGVTKSVLGFGAAVPPGTPLWRWVIGCAATLASSSRSSENLCPRSTPMRSISAAISELKRNGETLTNAAERGFMITWLPEGLPVLALTTRSGSLFVISRHDEGADDKDASENGAANHAHIEILSPAPGFALDDSNSIAIEHGNSP